MINLYPTPTELKEYEGKFIFDYVSIRGGNERIFSDTLSDITLSSEKTPNIEYIEKNDLPEEAYEITVNEQGVKVYYGTDSGGFYATQTLLQLIDKKEIPYLEIKDRPLLKHRDLSFDICRGKVPTMEHFKEIIDNLAKARYNALLIYTEDATVQIPVLKNIWKKDSLTLDELRTIKKWCNDKFIKLNIMVETFGHLNKVLCHDEFKHLSNSSDDNNPGGDLNPLDPRSLEFVDAMISGIIEFVDTDYFFIHGDEVRSLKTGKTKNEVEKRGETAVYMEYMNKVCQLVHEKYKKIPIMANDMFMVRGNNEQNKENLKIFPKNTIITDWGYESEYEYHTFGDNNKIFNELGIPFINMVSTGLFNEYIPRTYNAVMNAEVGCRTAYKYNGLGAVQTLWGDTGNSQFMVMEYEPIFTFGATAWNPENFQFEYVLDYLDKYLFKSENCSVSRVIADLGDIPACSKGKFPCTDGFHLADCSKDYDVSLLWDGPHIHTGIEAIYTYDAVDVSGCEKALRLIERSRKDISALTMNCEFADLWKEKLLLNLRMFEAMVKSSYVRLCVSTTSDPEKAKELSASLTDCYDDILNNFKNLWISENRESGVEIFMNYIEEKKERIKSLQKSLI